MKSRKTILSLLVVLVAFVLLEVEPQLVATHLINSFRSHEAASTSGAAATLAKLGTRALSPLLEGLKDKDEYVRAACLGVLAKIDSPRVVGPIADLLGDPNADLAGQAATALGEKGTPAVKTLAERLHDPDKATRLEGVKVLGQLIAQLSPQYAPVRTEAVTVLEQAANEGDADVKAAVISTLGLGLKLTAGPAHTCASYPVYLGGGTGHHAPVASVTKAAADRMLLVFPLEVGSVLGDEQDFQPLDVGIDGGELSAFGEGQVPFAKDDKAWDQLRATPAKIAAGGHTASYIYVFSVPKDSASWELTYKARSLAMAGSHGGSWVQINDVQQVQLGDQARPSEPPPSQEVSTMEYHALHILIMPDKEKQRAAAAAKAAGHSLPANFDADAAAKEKAERLLAQLQKGADFATLARANSDDPGSGAQGGDLGWFRGGQMVPEFDKEVKALKAGQMSGLVKTQFGYHIIKLLETRG